MKVQILRNCYVDNVACKAGDVVETTSAGLLIGSKNAKPYEQPKVDTSVKKKVSKNVKS